jgi:protein subunit release factor B
LFPVSEKKAGALMLRMNALGCEEREIEETLLKGGGVVLLHRPTGIRIRFCQQRSQGLNRFLARRTLVEELEARRLQKTRHDLKGEAIRRQKRRPDRSDSVDAQMRQYALRSSPDAHSPEAGAGSLAKLLEQYRAQEHCA